MLLYNPNASLVCSGLVRFRLPRSSQTNPYLSIYKPTYLSAHQTELYSITIACTSYMRVGLCLHACIYTHTPVRTYIHISTHKTYIHTYIHAYMHTCIHAYMHTCIHTLHTYMQHTHSHIHTYITLRYIHIHTYSTHIQTDRQTDRHKYILISYLQSYFLTFSHSYVIHSNNIVLLHRFTIHCNTLLPHIHLHLHIQTTVQVTTPSIAPHTDVTRLSPSLGTAGSDTSSLKRERAACDVGGILFKLLQCSRHNKGDANIKQLFLHPSTHK